jgi:hypothetical protein
MPVIGGPDMMPLSNMNRNMALNQIMQEFSGMQDQMSRNAGAGLYTNNITRPDVISQNQHLNHYKQQEMENKLSD